MKTAVPCHYQCDRSTCYHGVRIYGTSEFYCTFWRWDNSQNKAVCKCEEADGVHHKAVT